MYREIRAEPAAEPAACPQTVRSVKHKIKTRATTVIPCQRRQQDDPAPPLPAVPVCTVPVSLRSMKIFARVFRSHGWASGKIEWEDFEKAMSDAGWSHRCLGGSAVTFTEKGIRKRSIVIHRPHPRRVIEGCKLFNLRKRLEKRLGWHQETFVMRSVQVA